MPERMLYPKGCSIFLCHWAMARGLWGAFSFEKRTFAHRRGDTIPSHFVAANRAASSKSPRFIRRRRRFGDFPPDPLKTARPRGPAGPLILDFIPRDFEPGSA